MDLSTYIQQWTQSSIHILDVRYTLIPTGKPLPPYRFPANAFLLVSRGQGEFVLNQTSYLVSHSHVLHGNKGLQMQVISQEPLAYYLILYKTEHTANTDPLHVLNGLHNALEDSFALQTDYPAVLHQHAQKLYQTWMDGGDLARFKARAMFQLFLHEIMHQLDQQSAITIKPDIVDQAIRYIEEHFAESVTLDALSRALNYNVQYLSRKFKSKMGRSPIDYLIHFRMEKAILLLSETDAAVQDIACQVGYDDLFYFIRRFKKHTGLVPGQYRKQAAEQQLSNITYKRLKSSIWNSAPLNYTEWRSDAVDHVGEKGDSLMSKEHKTPLAVALLMCMMIMLSACGTSIQPSQASTSVEYQHDMGVTKLEGTPNKIAAADYRIMDTLNALGVYPHATTTYGGSTVLPYMDVDQQNPDILPLGDKINLEAAVESEPDLIIARHIEPTVYEQLSKVAPVIVFRGDGDWREEMKEIATVVGKEQQAEDWLAQYDLKAAQIKEKMAQHIGEDETFLFMRVQKNVQVASPNVHLGATLSKDLGLKYVPQLTNMKDTYETLSLETLPELNPDHIFMTIGKSTVSHDDEAEKVLEEMKQSAVWSNLKAVKAGNIHIMPQWVFGDYPNIKVESLELVEQALVK
ncbi:AraC family transcriptional regulator [Paenibacillus tundrae]|uniref:AraC family transcriptional regulator n=1 Tax=Paenibacillus tundrae TaxID=528187 RepID=UPI0030CD939E